MFSGQDNVMVLLLRQQTIKLLTNFLLDEHNENILHKNIWSHHPIISRSKNSKINRNPQLEPQFPSKEFDVQLLESYRNTVTASRNVVKK